MKNYEINFGNIPPDLEPDENITLWRYMSFSSLCEILMNDRIPLIGIHKFPDKSEGAILKGFYLSYVPIKRAFNIQCKNTMRQRTYPHGTKLKTKRCYVG